MLSFDNLFTQLRKLKKQISVIAKFFSFASTFTLLIMYGVMIGIHFKDVIRLIIYILLAAITLFIFIFEFINLVRSSKGQSEVETDIPHHIYVGIKTLTTLFSLGYSGYLIYGQETASFSLAIFILSCVIYVISLFINFVKLIGGNIINNIIVATKMDLEDNAVGTLLKKTNFLDVESIERLKGEDKMRNKIRKETDVNSQNKPKEKIDGSIVKTVFQAFKTYKKKTAIRLAYNDKDGIRSLLRNEMKESTKIIKKNDSLKELIQEINFLIQEPSFVNNKSRIEYLISYIKNNMENKKLLKSSKLINSVTVLRIINDYHNPLDYEPLLIVVLDEIEK